MYREGVRLGYYKLARAMINEAVKDYYFATGQDRETAEMFFISGEYFEMMCKVAELSPTILLSGLGLAEKVESAAKTGEMIVRQNGRIVLRTTSPDEVREFLSLSESLLRSYLESGEPTETGHTIERE